MQPHADWKIGVEAKAVQFVQHTQSLEQIGLEPLPSLTLCELEDHQHQDLVVSKILPLVLCKTRPSRRERSGFGPGQLVLLKYWDRLRVRNVILTVSRNQRPVTKVKRIQSVLYSMLALKIELWRVSITWQGTRAGQGPFISPGSGSFGQAPKQA